MESNLYGRREIREVVEMSDMYKQKDWLEHQHCILKKTVRQIAEECGAPQKTVSYYKEKYKIKTPKEVRYSGVKKYELNDDYFSLIETPAQAYWLGFIVADGSILTEACDTKRLAFCIQEQDASHLEKFRDMIGSTAPVGKRTTQLFSIPHFQAMLRINSTKLCDDLIALGVEPQKSTKEKYPSGIPTHLEPHFWRGIIDGDGCISIYETKGKTVAQLSVIGSLEIIETFEKFLKSKIDFRAKPLVDNNNYTLTLSGLNALAAAKLIYEDAPIVLDRKYNLYKQLIDLYEKI